VSLFGIFSLRRFGILRNNFGYRNEEQATAESSSDVRSSLNDGGGGGKGPLCNPSSRKAGGKQKELRRLMLTSSSTTPIDSRGKAAGCSFRQSILRAKMSCEEQQEF